MLELLTDARARADQRIAGLGPDILAPELDEPRILRRLREDDPTRPIGDALLDQRTVAGIGNIWKCEALLGGAGRSVAKDGGRRATTRSSRCCARCARGCRRARAWACAPASDRVYGRAGTPVPALRRDRSAPAARATTTG